MNEASIFYEASDAFAAFARHTAARLHPDVERLAPIDRVCDRFRADKRADCACFRNPKDNAPAIPDTNAFAYLHA